MAIRTGDWNADRDHSDLVAQLNDDALGEAYAAADLDPEPPLEVYP